MVRVMQMNPRYKTVVPLSVPFIVPPAPMTKKNNDVAAKIGYLLESGT
jgi:hypothetical protein